MSDSPASCKWVITETKSIEASRWSEVEHWVRIEPSDCGDYTFPKVGQLIVLAPGESNGE